MTASVSPNYPLTASQPSPVSFSGRGKDFLNMLISGSLFLIPTLGFYRFWLITKLRRHLWANTQIEGEAFEYTGTAKELLIGFFIALAVLAPLYILTAILSAVLEGEAAFASAPLVLIMYVLIHFGSYRARKYRASRTVFRGVRFWMKGSGWAYAFRAILWDFATLLTLGLALPWAAASLERYRMRNTYFGTLQGHFAGTGWALFKRGWWVWAMGIAILIGLIFLPQLIAMSSALVATEDASASVEGLTTADIVMMFVPLLVILVPLSIIPLALAIFTRWQIDGVRFGEVTLSSHLRLGTFYGLFFKMIFSSIGFLLAIGLVCGIGAFIFWNFVQEAITAIENDEITWAILGFIMLGVVVYLIIFLGMGIIQRYFFGRGLWAAVVTTTTVSNLRAADQAIAAGQASGSMGEGLADALDFNVSI